MRFRHYWSRFSRHAAEFFAAVRALVLAHPRASAGIALGAIAVALGVWLFLRSRRPTAEEIERRRRAHLVAKGRLTDGSIVDARTLDGEDSYYGPPDILLYRYRISGVTYDCGQDVSTLHAYTAGLRIDQPVQVRYDPRQPGNSIIVSEDWCGLRVGERN
jgi:hypothetical protein